MTLEEAKKLLEKLQKDDENFSFHLELTDGKPTYFDNTSKKFRKEAEAIDTVLKALEEQQKEIEEITTENENLTLSQLDFTKRNISKEKIREKIKELGKDIPMMTPRYFDWDSSEVIKLLKELLSEE